MADYLSITETPGALLNREQMGRMALRYSLAAQMGAGRRVLEVSCGAGVGLGLLVEPARSLAACDFSTRALSIAQHVAGGQVMLAAADAQTLPYAGGLFDLVVSFEAIYYLQRPDAFLQESRRVLAPGGQMLLGASNPDWPFFVPGVLSVHYLSAPELAAQLDAAGFAMVRLFGSLPVDRSVSPYGALRSRARQHLLRVRLLRTDNPWTRLLKRLSYGPLTPLPALLPPELRISSPFDELTPLPIDRPDDRHRVLFAVALRN